VTATQR